MFKHSCFLYKNTPELRQYLDKIGYKYGGKATEFNQPYLYCSLDKYFECNSFPARYHGIIDCAENENLFKAIAALRNNTDKNQWFICQEEYISTHTMELVKVGTWQMNTQYDKLTYGLKHLWRKASVQELIEHFK